MIESIVGYGIAILIAIIMCIKDKRKGIQYSLEDIVIVGLFVLFGWISVILYAIMTVLTFIFGIAEKR